MFQKVKGILNRKGCKLTMALCLVCSFMAVGAFAAEGESSADLTAAFSTGFQQIASDAVTMIATIVPIALGVAGTVFLVKKAMSWFKSLAK